MMDYQHSPMEQKTHLLSDRLLELQSGYKPIEAGSEASIVELLKGLQAYDLSKSVDRLNAFLDQVERLLNRGLKLPEFKYTAGPFIDTDVPYTEEEKQELEKGYVDELTFYKEKLNELLGHLYLQMSPTDGSKFVTDLAADKILALIRVLRKLGHIKNTAPTEIAKLVAKSFTSKMMANLEFGPLRNAMSEEPSSGDLRFLDDLCDAIKELVKKNRRGEESLKILRKDN